MRNPYAGALMVCRACGTGNGADDVHCRRCGGSLRDAVPIRGAGDFGNEAGRAYHAAQVHRHRRWSVAVAMAATALVQMFLALVGLFSWWGIAFHGVLALVVTGVVAWRRLGHLPTIALGGTGVMVLWWWQAANNPGDFKPTVAALIWAPIQVYVYLYSGSSLRSSNDLADG